MDSKTKYTMLSKAISQPQIGGLHCVLTGMAQRMSYAIRFLWQWLVPVKDHNT